MGFGQCVRRGELGFEAACQRGDDLCEHIAVLGRGGGDLSDGRWERAPTFEVVAVGRREVARDDHLGTIVGELLLEVREQHVRRLPGASVTSASFDAKCARFSTWSP